MIDAAAGIGGIAKESRVYRMRTGFWGEYLGSDLIGVTGKPLGRLSLGRGGSFTESGGQTIVVTSHDAHHDDSGMRTRYRINASGWVATPSQGLPSS